MKAARCRRENRAILVHSFQTLCRRWREFRLRRSNIVVEKITLTGNVENFSAIRVMT